MLQNLQDDPAHMKAVGKGQPGDMGGVFEAVAKIVLFVALAPAFVHSLWLLGKFSWELIG